MQNIKIKEQDRQTERLHGGFYTSSARGATCRESLHRGFYTISELNYKF